MRPFVVRDIHAEINGNKEVFTMPSGGIDIVGEDGRTLFSIQLTKGGNGIEVSAGSTITVDNAVFDSSIVVKPRASNSVHILRTPYNL